MPSASEKVAANQLRQIIAAHVDGGATLRVLDDDRQPVDVTLTPALSHLLLDLLGHIGRGDAVTLVPVHQMLSTQQAALVGRHRRIRAEDLFAYKQARDARRGAALADLAQNDSELQ